MTLRTSPTFSGVQGGGGFVEEDDFGVHGQGPGDGDALLLAAGEFGGGSGPPRTRRARRWLGVHVLVWLIVFCRRV